MAKVAVKIYRYRYHGKSLFTYRLLTELKIPLPYISVNDGRLLNIVGANNRCLLTIVVVNDRRLPLHVKSLLYRVSPVC